MSIGSYSGKEEPTGKNKPQPGNNQGGANMCLSSAATDNITEILFKIFEFTQNRQKILIQNINAADRSDFVPKDLPAEEFADLMFLALIEHTSSRRLLLCDGRNVKFGAGGSFETKPMVDEQARELLAEDQDAYMEYEISKLFENSLNQRIAGELIKQRYSDELFPGRRLN